MYLFYSVCVHACTAHATACMGGQRTVCDSWFSHISPWAQTQVIKLGGRLSLPSEFVLCSSQLGLWFPSSPDPCCMRGGGQPISSLLHPTVSVSLLSISLQSGFCWKIRPAAFTVCQSLAYLCCGTSWSV